jgi:hypothetical protein
MVLNVNNDEPPVAGDIDEQRRLHEQRNTDHISSTVMHQVGGVRTDS